MVMKSGSAIKRRIKRNLKNQYYLFDFHVNGRLNAKRKYQDVIWVVGDGRSGTTWVSSLINNRKKYRFMFEPFHPLEFPWMNQFKTFQYIRPENHSNYFLKRGRVIFNGQVQNRRINRNNQYPDSDGLLVKDIHSHLFLNWVDHQFPFVKKVMILRHPCAVALSKMRLNQWNWPQDPDIFWSQVELIQDYLSDFEYVMKKAQSTFERYILTWSILHFVPLQQLDKKRLHLVFYEALCTNPEHELHRLFSYLGEPTHFDPELRETFNTPSRTSRDHSAINTGNDLINGWRGDLTREQTKKALDILSVFGLDQIYDETPAPNIEQAERFRESRIGTP